MREQFRGSRSEAQLSGRFRGECVIERKVSSIAYDSRVNPIKDDVTVQWDIAVTVEK